MDIFDIAILILVFGLVFKKFISEKVYFISLIIAVLTALSQIFTVGYKWQYMPLYTIIIISALNVFIIVYAYSLDFFPKKWRKKIDQDTLVGLALIFFTMTTMFAWIIYFYINIFGI